MSILLEVLIGQADGLPNIATNIKFRIGVIVPNKTNGGVPVAEDITYTRTLFKAANDASNNWWAEGIYEYNKTIRSSNIYGLSNVIRPQSITTCYWKRFQ